MPVRSRRPGCRDAPHAAWASSSRLARARRATAARSDGAESKTRPRARALHSPRQPSVPDVRKSHVGPRHAPAAETESATRARVVRPSGPCGRRLAVDPGEEDGADDRHDDGVDEAALRPETQEAHDEADYFLPAEILDMRSARAPAPIALTSVGCCA